MQPPSILSALMILRAAVRSMWYSISREDVLRDLEGELLPSLPIIHRATSVQLWSGPALSTQRDGWHLVETFPLAN